MQSLRRLRPSRLPTSRPLLYAYRSRPHRIRSHPSPRRHHSTHNVDPSEVSHFSALASSWWDPHGPSRILHLMNPLRHRFIAECLASSSSNANAPPDTSAPQSKLSYLDIGCGGGIFAESAARLPTTSEVLAIDPTPEVLAVARAHQRQDPRLCEPGRLTYQSASIEELPAGEGQRDIVTVFEVLEHVPQPAALLEAAGQHVKPGGWLILSTIARTWTSWAITKVVAEDVLRVVPRGTHDWNRYINPAEMAEWAAERGEWESPRIMGVVYVPGLGWKEVQGSEGYGNYFFGIRKRSSD